MQNKMSLNYTNHPTLSNHLIICKFNYFKLIIYFLIFFVLHQFYSPIHSFPTSNSINYSHNLSNHVNTNSLSQYLKEPDLVNVYKDRVVLRIYPLTKKETEISWYYVIVELINDQPNIQPYNRFNSNQPVSKEIDFSLNYFSSLKKGLPFFAAIKLHNQHFANKNYITVIVGKHHVDLTKPREFRLTDYVNPLLDCGKEYRFGVAGELKNKNHQNKKEFIYVPYFRTIILNENGTCDTFPIETYALFFALSFIALVVSLVSFMLLLTVNVLTTGRLCFWKRKKMNCEQLFKDDDSSTYKECLTLINHTGINENEDCKGGYDQISITKSKVMKKLDKSKPIVISDLFDYYNRMNSENLFKKEFESVPKGKLSNWKIATLKINQRKNRFLSLLAYDLNRVVLKAFPNEPEFIESEKFNDKKLTKVKLELMHLRPTDYINSSLIDILDHSGNLIPKRYICTQTPLASTVNDYWKMVYQTNSYQLVIMTSSIDFKHWPDIGTTKIYGKISCTCKEEHDYADYTIRVFRIELIDEDSLNNNKSSFDAGRDVTLYHLKRWPDNSIPDYSDSIALFLSSVRTHWSYNKKLPIYKNDDLKINQTNTNEFELKNKQQLGPIIVSCTAGIGRTGAFCLLDSILDQAIKLKEDDNFENYKIDILKQFVNLRKQRVNLVEKVSQYAFVHQVLVEMLCSRNVKDVLPQDYEQYYKMLSESSTKAVNDSKNISKLEEQFNILNKFRIQFDDNQRSVGIFNLKKNRNRQTVPKNSVRVLLPIVDNDYINAVYINGFKYDKEFIVTEVPLKEMRNQFWQMVNSEKIDTIVCLNTIESQNVYWPTELNNPLIFRGLEIDLMFEEKSTDYYVKRQFRINKKKVVYQMHYKHWDPISKRPTNLPTFCLFQKAVQMHLNKNSSFSNQFIVQCLNGNTASGLFCITKHIVDRLFAENLINIFLSTKYVRTNRMQFCEDKEQWSFLYEYIQLIIKSFYSKDYKNLCFSMN